MRSIDVGRKRSGKHNPANRKLYVAANRAKINARRNAWRAGRVEIEREQERLRRPSRRPYLVARRHRDRILECIRGIRRKEELTAGDLAKITSLRQSLGCGEWEIKVVDM